MKPVICIISMLLLSACIAGTNQQNQPLVNNMAWQDGMDVEQFWRDYAASRGGITWGQSTSYPEYNQVNEGDTFMVEVDQGLCLMEFFHNRWRRANDVRRWDDSINDYGGCPFVFD